MYKEFFGLETYPFNVNPDPRFLIPTRDTQEALACMKYGIEQRRGFILLTGEVGTGKTTLLNQLLEGLRHDKVTTAFIFYPRVTVYQFLDFIVTDFGVACGSRQKSQILLHLNEWLLEHYRAGKNAVLIVDEAQTLSHEVLEEIRLLTNLETATDKLLQIVLSGQPELEDKLNQFSLRQLRQRITLRCRTSPLNLQETQTYISERLKIAGANGEAIFTPEAFETIFRYSQGIPRVINVLCEQALIASFADQRKPIPSSAIEGAARDFGLDRISPVGRPQPAGDEAPQSSAGPSPGYEFRTLLSRLRESLK